MLGKQSHLILLLQVFHISYLRLPQQKIASYIKSINYAPAPTSIPHLHPSETSLINFKVGLVYFIFFPPFDFFPFPLLQFLLQSIYNTTIIFLQYLKKIKIIFGYKVIIVIFNPFNYIFSKYILFILVILKKETKILNHITFLIFSFYN